MNITDEIERLRGGITKSAAEIEINRLQTQCAQCAEYRAEVERLRVEIRRLRSILGWPVEPPVST